jgi:pyoverdine/dityrosine biosynthesis protein Dit1
MISNNSLAVSGHTKSPTDLSDSTHRILERVLANRKVQAVPGEPADTPEDFRGTLFAARIEAAVRSGKPIPFLVPAFPFKVPALHKTFGGPHADFAEEASVQHLNRFLRGIEDVYAPGANLTIASDGHVFRVVWSSWYDVTEADVIQYQSDLRSYIAKVGAQDKITIWDLADAYPDDSIDAKRARMVAAHVPFEETIRRVRQPGTVENAQYVGQMGYFYHDGFESTRRFEAVERLLAEMGVTGADPRSNSSLVRVAKWLAQKSIHLTEAWGARFEREFPDMARISVHDYRREFRLKVGFYMTPAREMNVTPWHGVMVLHRRTGQMELMFRRDAEARGYTLIEENGRPNRYETD